MKYIIMAGTHFSNGDWKNPRHLTYIAGEILICRTIRLLQKAGVEDIAITGTDERFKHFGVPLIQYNSSGPWTNAFYPAEEPVCYIFGDVYFSPEAIQTIVETETDGVEFFASAPPFSVNYCKQWAEPFAFKVQDYIGFRNAVEITQNLANQGMFRRDPIAWELWQVIKGSVLNHISYNNYTVINDYTCDLDYPSDVQKLEKKLQDMEDTKTVNYLIHTCPSRLWYVEQYLIPSLEKQGCENISIYLDYPRQGSLKAYMSSFLRLPENNEGTWHLQDDVIICKDFAERTRIYNGGIVCGFSSARYDKQRPAGIVDVNNNWFSFPCIRIPNKIAKNCANWVNQYIIGNAVYRKFWVEGTNEDWAFWTYVKDFYKDIKINNLAPNLVDHIDYLIGGSALGKERICRSQYWEDEELIQQLKRQLEKRICR